MGAKLANAEEIIAFDDRKNANKKLRCLEEKNFKINFKKCQNYFDKVFISAFNQKI